ncbi:uncharacterized protein LOC130657679 isoform X2 [Hydractinia symbiolongicarpus]|uniref:uncharacterized protein LOC130657679 isoform X2 n=1 Tax=Hydractinia symbiolongicarpus TaxID=13093 RepID=UPI00254F069C|nr:uncharacterized protein LOC130657679 isoform X2 [Hydractinia symbiolongicarpus]
MIKGCFKNMFKLFLALSLIAFISVCEAKPLDVHKLERVLDDLIAEFEVDSQVGYDTRQINKNIKRLKELAVSNSETEKRAEEGRLSNTLHQRAAQKVVYNGKRSDRKNTDIFHNAMNEKTVEQTNSDSRDFGYMKKSPNAIRKRKKDLIEVIKELLKRSKHREGRESNTKNQNKSEIDDIINPIYFIQKKNIKNTVSKRFSDDSEKMKKEKITNTLLKLISTARSVSKQQDEEKHGESDFEEELQNFLSSRNFP